MLFFFSSRRRHTRFKCDWSSDVCSSDLLLVELAELTQTPVIPTLMGWGSIPDDHPLNAGMMGLQTMHRYGNATFLRSDFVLGIGNRWANRQTGSLDVFTKGGKFVPCAI